MSRSFMMLCCSSVSGRFSDPPHSTGAPEGMAWLQGIHVQGAASFRVARSCGALRVRLGDGWPQDDVCAMPVQRSLGTRPRPFALLRVGSRLGMTAMGKGIQDTKVRLHHSVDRLRCCGRCEAATGHSPGQMGSLPLRFASLAAAGPFAFAQGDVLLVWECETSSCTPA
jgi:hypothetical protein